MRITKTFMLGLLVTAGACVTGDGDDAEAPDETLSEVEQGLFGSTITAGGAGNKVVYLNESGSTHTCFLRGIRGSLAGTRYSWQDRTTASVDVVLNSSTNKWEIRTKAGLGPGVWADVSCVMATGNRRFLSKLHGGAGNDAPITANRRCFMTGISAYGSAMMGRLYNNDLPGARVWTYGGTWRVGTWFIDNADEHSDGSARAVCFDVSGLGETGAHYVENGDLEIFNWGNASDWACGSTGFFGVMTGGSTTGGRSYKSNNRWRANATSNKRLISQCYL